MVAALIVQLDARSEESLKVYDIFLSFCSLLQMRTPTALAVLKCPSKEQRLTTPVLSICSTAQMTFDEAIIPEVPLKAIRLLRYILRVFSFIAVSNDDDLRADILEVVTAPLCAHIVESQMLSNPVVPFMGRPVAQRTDPLPKWRLAV
uniref:Uncharacterized protein n=1 Tax=Parascaris equorum TaxID=6256 RepID=A0A914R822_PAREQ